MQYAVGLGTSFAGPAASLCGPLLYLTYECGLWRRGAEFRTERAFGGELRAGSGLLVGNT
jgi:hypothetical protein